MELRDRMAEWWDIDARTYDDGPDHGASSPGERAAWTAALQDHLPAAPARVLDAGAGTGFLAVPTAELGHEVTALDLSRGMLARLRDRAATADVHVEVVVGPAEEPPPGPFDVVMQRHLLWTLPDPVGALRAWREVTSPDGRLVCFGGLWGAAAGPVYPVSSRLRTLARRARGGSSGHHGSYAPDVVAALPHASGLPLDTLVELVERAGWTSPSVTRLRDVEWARTAATPWPERLLGTIGQYVLVAQAPGDEAGVPSRA